MGGNAPWLRRGIVRLLTGRLPRRLAPVLGAGLARRFVAGPSLADALEAVRLLGRRGLGATVNLLGEGPTTPGSAAAAVACYAEAARLLAAAGADAGLSVKPSQFGPGGSEALRRVLAAAAAAGRFVWVDMEGSEATEDTLHSVLCARAAGLPVGVCLQAALRRSPADLRRLDAAGVPVRLVKGAYAERAGIAYRRRAEVDRAFLDLAAGRLRRGLPLAAATHDERLIARLCAAAPSRAALEFQMLYGVRPGLQARLAAAGWSVRIYVPFGPQWYPYVVRRIAERPANLLLLLRRG